MTAQPTTNAQRDDFVLTSTVLAVILRVAGPVITDVRPHALGTPERQVVVRLGDVLLCLTDEKAAARLRERWDGAQYLAATRLPDRVSQTWLQPNPDAYPVGVALRLAGNVPVDTRWVTGRRETRTPAYLRVCVDHRLVWQVCDMTAWRAIGDALFDAQRHLQQG